MEENKFNVNLANISDVFNNKTFRYRINGFAHACHMHDIGVFSNSSVLFNCEGFSKLGNKKTSEEHSYFISTSASNSQKGKSITLSGQYNDLIFSFINYYNKEKLDKKIIDLPFFISLIRTIDEITYKFTMETVDGARTKFMIIKSREFKNETLHDDIVFYANVNDFSEILKLVKSFIYNPKLVFDTYNEMMQQQHIVFTNNMLNKMAMQDTKLDKPVGKIKKIVKKIIG